MTVVTLRVLDGADRGRVFADLPTPVTIGREEGNTVQLNDERISRYHLKIQEDHDQLVLTDLASTNGTKVNGEDIQLRILRHGDVIHVGRSVLLFGSEDQIAIRLAKLRGVKEPDDGTMAGQGGPSLPQELNWTDDPTAKMTFQALEPPELPTRLTPAQAARLSELIEYVNIRLRELIASVDADEKSKDERVTLLHRHWQNLLDLQWRMAEYLRQIGSPASEDE